MPGRAQAGAQRAHVHRLGQEVVHPGLEGFGDFFLGVEAGEHDQVDRLPPLGGAQRARELEAAEPGHQPVGDDDLGLGLDRERERLGAGAGTHHRMAERVAQHGFHDGARGGIVVDQQHAQRTGAAAVLGAQRVRGGHLRERGQRRGRHAQQFAPGAPASHQLVDGGAELFGVEADLAAKQQQLGGAAVVFGVGRQAEVGNAARQIEQVHQLVRARSGREPGCVGTLVVVDRLDQRAGEAPLEQQRGGEFVVIGVQVLLLERDQAARGVGVLQQAAVGGGINRGERQATDLRQQATGE